ncbi:MAG: UvrD-helicase domain-containing protein [Acidimicrobiales bacterium]
MTTLPPPPLDLTDDLFDHPRLVIEASAGTGKTFTLAALVSRYVAELATPIEEILVVTFTRAAAAELRERVRRRLVETAHHLAAPDPAVADPLLIHLASCDDGTRLDRLRLVEQAVSDYDTATITTIHGFCQQVLATIGTAAAHNPEAVLVQDISELVVGVASDLLVGAALSGEVDLPSLDSLTNLVRTVLNNPGIDVVAASGEPADERLAELVRDSTAEIHRRLTAAGSTTYDRLLTGVRDAVVADPALRQRIAKKFPVALIDEFQDTDPVQWEIFSSAFGAPPSRLVIVGDPKQAIYSFRGGDVHTYLGAATDPAATTRTLATNWRSDGAVVQAMNGMCDGLVLGDEGIAFHRVEVDPGHARRRLVAADGSGIAPVSVRLVTDPGLDRLASGAVAVGPARDLIAEDLAHQVAGLLRSGSISDDGNAPGRPLHAGDVAVLIRAHSEGPPIQRALARRGVASVITGGRSVTESAAADQWRVLLAALSRPSDPGRARAAALTWFWGWSPAELSEATDDALADVQFRHDQWAGVLRVEGVSALVSRIRHESPLVGLVLARPEGERDLTDLEHLAELLHQASEGRPVGAAQLNELLVGLDRDKADEDDPEAVKRRVDSDEAAVQIMTVHAAKGLEFGVVCCPSLWNPSALTVRSQLFFDPDLGRRVLDVSQSKKKHAGVKRNKDLATADQIGENARLAYVALTRARHRAIVWFTGANGSAKTGIARVLFGPGSHDGGPTAPASLPSDDRCRAELESRFLERGAEGVEVIEVPFPAPIGGPVDSNATDTVAGTAAPDPADQLSVARLGRRLDRSAGRWSFTAMTSFASVDPDDDSLGDEGSSDEEIDERAEGGEGAVAPFATAVQPTSSVPLGEVGAGAAFGTLVHAVLEDVDFAASDLDDQVARAIADRSWLSDAVPDVDLLGTGIRAALETPMGSAFGERALTDLERRDRLDELDFELPLGAGLEHRVATRAIGRLVASRLEPDDLLRPWADRLAAGLIDLELGGFLTGSIDLVLRVPGADHSPRYSVVDYKTNRVSPPGSPVALDDFHPDALAAAMVHHHYPLQALLYSVALHRYLRWRLADYHPDRHLGPIGYLFLRGMIGPSTPAPDGRPYGVFTWHLPSGLVADLSRLLAGEEVAA